ncbi:MAG: hypothetical protein Q9157_002815 [Trypethelium eluteriae]
MVILVSRALSVLYAVPRNPTPQGAAQSPAIQNPTPTTTVLSLIFDDEHQFGMHCLDDDCQETFSVPRTYGVRPDQGRIAAQGAHISDENAAKRWAVSGRHSRDAAYALGQTIEA